MEFGVITTTAYATVFAFIGVVYYFWTDAMKGVGSEN